MIQGNVIGSDGKYKEVDTFNDLGTATASLEKILVLNPQGSYALFNKKRAGLYYDNGSWVRLGKLPTATEIKQIYESNPDTNEYSDAEKLKLASIKDYFSKDIIPVITFSTVGVNHNLLVINGLDNAKDYIIECFAIWSHDRVSTNAFFELQNNGINILSERLIIEPKDSSGVGIGGTTQRIPMNIKAIIKPVSGSLSLSLLLGTENTNHETTVYESLITVRQAI